MRKNRISIFKAVFGRKITDSDLTKYINARKIVELRITARKFGIDFMLITIGILSAGFGLKCESCQLFLMHPPIKESEKFIPAIKEYYRQVELYEKYLTEQAKADKLLEHMSGAGI